MERFRPWTAANVSSNLTAAIVFELTSLAERFRQRTLNPFRWFDSTVTCYPLIFS